jgi:hypothetical protein
MHFLSRIPKTKSPWVSDRVIWVARECSRHDLSIFPGMFGWGTASHPWGSGEEVLQHVEVHVTRNGSLGVKEWSVNLCLLTAQKTFTFGLSRTWIFSLYRNSYETTEWFCSNWNTLRPFHVSKVRHFDGRQQRTNQWWPRVLGFKWRRTWGVDKCSETNCLVVSLFVWSK